MRIIMMLILAISLMFANGTIQMKEGWQLIGVPTTLDVRKSFNNKSVDITWGFNALSQSWMGYSPDRKIAEGLDALTTLEPFQALWVRSKENWKFKYVTQESLKTPKNSSISLEKGWNLVSIPQQIVVSDKFFGKDLVWKYSDNQKWSVNDSSFGFPSIDTIKQSEGLWVKSDEAKSINIDDQGSKLNTFESRESMLSYIRKMIEMSKYYFGYYNTLDGIADIAITPTAAIAEATASPAKTTDTTTTNLQEAGVDEGDILKHDGTYIFSVDNIKSKIVVTSFENIAKKIYTPIESIDFSNKNIISIYLQDSRLTVISNSANRYIYGGGLLEAESRLSIIAQNDNYLNLEIFDVSNIHNITSIASHKIDGNYQDSRLINGELYLISQFSPTIEYEYKKLYIQTTCSALDKNEIYASCDSVAPISVLPVEENATSTSTAVDGVSIVKRDCKYGKDYALWVENSCYQYNYDDSGAWKYDYDNPIAIGENLVPKITSESLDSKIENELVSHDKFYAPIKLNQRANITSLSHFSTKTGKFRANSSFLGNTHTYYASLTSLYLVSSEYPLYYDYVHFKDQQMIYKFSFDNNLSYRGQGFVDGRMLNQFSMSEKGDYLRVATTSGWSWFNGGETTNTVYTLKQIDETLKVDGKLTGLGHKGETIRAVRFIGDRGFVVTFKQTDPLYTLDLSNPKEPKVVGELSIPGFSNYLHVIDENRILSIGRNADVDGRTRELQFQLFDISDFSNPKLADKIQIGDVNSYSEAEYNHKAFSYRSSDLIFGIPYRDYSKVDNLSSEHFGVYQVNGLSIDSVHTLDSNSSNWGNVGRGLIFDLNTTTYGALFKGLNIMSEKIK